MANVREQVFSSEADSAQLDVRPERRRSAATAEPPHDALFYRAVITSLNGHVAVLDRDGTVLAVNDAWLGFARENGTSALAGVCAGGNYLEFCRGAVGNGDQTAGLLVTGIEEVLAGARERFALEYAVDAPTGVRWFITWVTPLKSRDGGAVVEHLDISERKRAEEELSERLRFEQLLTDISATFVNVLPVDFDRHVETALETIGTFLGVDRVNVFETVEDGSDLRGTHSWVSEGIEPLPPLLSTQEFHWATGRLLAGLVVAFGGTDELPDEAAFEKSWARRHGQRSQLTIPLLGAGTPMGALAFDAVRRPRTWAPALVRRLQLLGEIFANVLLRRRAEADLRLALDSVVQLTDRLREENVYLHREVTLHHDHDEVVGESVAITHVLALIEQVAPTDSTVLLLGETGTGKELLAWAIHKLSPRRTRAMVKVNCAALPPTLIEGELFGREKGAYTGALSKHVGRFEMAHRSTLFLDEIGELPLELQVKLLRVLQEGEFERLGGTATLKVNVRIIAASNRDLAKAVREGTFREDLYYRLNVFPMTVPPLRTRRDDIPLLLWAFVDELGRSMGKAVESISKRTMRELQEYDWPGNVRELHNVIERAMILHEGPTLTVELPTRTSATPDPCVSLEEVERRHISAVLEETGWRIRGKQGAAEMLVVKPTTLESRIQKLGIHRPLSIGPRDSS